MSMKLLTLDTTSTSSFTSSGHIRAWSRSAFRSPPHPGRSADPPIRRPLWSVRPLACRDPPGRASSEDLAPPRYLAREWGELRRAEECGGGVFGELRAQQEAIPWRIRLDPSLPRWMSFVGARPDPIARFGVRESQ